MANYYVNTNAQLNGDHEVHKEDCWRLPKEQNRLYLGDFSWCGPAVEAAKQYFSQSDGCVHCCPDCHTS